MSRDKDVGEQIGEHLLDLISGHDDVSGGTDITTTGGSDGVDFAKVTWPWRG